MKPESSSQEEKGFTLIELAVVLIVVGILLGSFMGTLTGRIDVTRKSDAINELEEIKQAMMAYAFVNGYLPCPDCDMVGGNCVAAVVGDGIADYNAGACLENEGAGNVPWVTLGLGKSDPWGTHYRYAVQNLYADVNIAFGLDAASGSAVVREPDFAADATGATPQALANNVVAVIFSHGKNSFGGSSEENIARDPVPAANIDELENVDDDQFYYMRAETSADSAIAGGEFDDIVIWISEYELKARMVDAGRLPP